MWHILVVDDNPNNCMLLVSTLEDLAECDVAENGEDALVAYDKSLENKKPYDAIRLDIAMPGIDGV
jgi:two-component system chemotaxis response regulator CheY